MNRNIFQKSSFSFLRRTIVHIFYYLWALYFAYCDHSSSYSVLNINYYLAEEKTRRDAPRKRKYFSIARQFSSANIPIIVLFKLLPLLYNFYLRAFNNCSIFQFAYISLCFSSLGQTSREDCKERGEINVYENCARAGV